MNGSTSLKIWKIKQIQSYQNSRTKKNWTCKQNCNFVYVVKLFQTNITFCTLKIQHKTNPNKTNPTQNNHFFIYINFSSSKYFPNPIPVFFICYWIDSNWFLFSLISEPPFFSRIVPLPILDIRSAPTLIRNDIKL